MGVLYDVSTKKNESLSKFNKSGCLDLTAYTAIMHVDAERERDRLHQMIDILHAVCELNYFHIEEHVVLKDRRTGKIYR